MRNWTKQRHAARRVWQRLIAKRGADVSEATVTHFQVKQNTRHGDGKPVAAGSVRMARRRRPSPSPQRQEGRHSRRPGRTRLCEGHGLARPMPERGRGPDDARCEGLLGRIKAGFFCGCDWDGVAIEKLVDMLDPYLG